MFRSDKEKTQWTKNVDIYVKIMKEEMKKSNILGEQVEVSHLHTGSIPSQYGKPLMLMQEFSHAIQRSHSGICSDHDVMVIVDSFPVEELPISTATSRLGGF